jgi:hypothetical protein
MQVFPIPEIRVTFDFGIYCDRFACFGGIRILESLVAGGERAGP